VLIDVRLSNVLAHTAVSAMDAERDGYHAGWVGETGHDPFLPLVVAADHARALRLGISTAVAFARSPMTTAYLADDLASFSGGRFILGLGAQVSAHVRGRFSMPYSRPVARMREYVAALREIWGCWRDGRALDFRGDFYQHTLMTPAFAPEQLGTPAPPVYLGAVGPRMASLAGEIADGLLAHLLTSPRYLREVTVPAVATGLAAAGRERSDIKIVVPIFVVTGATELEFNRSRDAVRRQLAFYASTPAYAPVLATHGWSDLHWELHEMSLAGDWDEMPDLIDDEVLSTLAIEGEPAAVARMIWSRYGQLADRIVLSPEPGSNAPWGRIVSDLRALTSHHDTVAATPA
jgi:probable F420-dependent oxidoreductase